MGRHRITPIAARLRVNRGFDSAWYSDAGYAQMLQKDWLLSRAVWSFMGRSSRAMPRTAQKEDPKLAAEAAAAAAAGGAPVAAPPPRIPGQQKMQKQEARDFPRFRTGRIFMQHLPYKSIASAFAYVPPREGPQAKYGLFQPRAEARK